MKNYIFTFIFFISLLVQGQDFSSGPYGTNYLDIAGPFYIEDLGVRQQGDLDGNRTIDLKDILLFTSFLDGEININEDDLFYADINDDLNIDIVDIILSIDKIFNFTPAIWSFEDSWTGEESYMLIPSNTLWQQNVKLELTSKFSIECSLYFLIQLRF